MFSHIRTRLGLSKFPVPLFSLTADRLRLVIILEVKTGWILCRRTKNWDVLTCSSAVARQSK